VRTQAVVPTAEDSQPQQWRYTTDQPSADDWTKPGFDDSRWKTGAAGFGTENTPGAIVRTKWDTPAIWLRRTFDLPEGKTDDLEFRFHHDEDCEIYLNGVLAARGRYFITNYVEQQILPEALATLKPGENTIAVACRQSTGGQYIDVGIVRLKASTQHQD
jgi:hypothetical protein